MIDKRRYLTEDGKYDWQKFDLLTENEQNEIMNTWDSDQWEEYTDKDGYWTLDEFNEILRQINIEVCLGNGSDNIYESKEDLGPIS
jgi:hypothetical protein